MNAMAAVREALMAGPGDPGPSEPPVPVFRDPIAPGQIYRLPSGRAAAVTSVGGANVQLAYQDEVVLRRDALVRLATRVLSAGGST